MYVGYYCHVYVCVVLLSCVFLVVYDVSAKQSFAALEVWLNELDTYASKKDIVKMLVGNKIDIVSSECL